MTQTRIIALLIGLAALLGLLSLAAFTVRQSESAIVLRFGKPQRVLESPGLYFKAPLADEVVRLDRRVLNFDAPAQELLTKDQKRVVISAFVRYQIVDPLRFYQVGKTTANAEGQIRSVLGSTLRTVIGNVPMAEILTAQRAAFMSEITQQLTRQAAAPYGIKIVDVRFKRVDLPAANSAAVYNRMRTQRAQEAAGIRASGAREAAEKKAEADKIKVVTLAEAQKSATALRGEGDALATRIYNEAYGRDPAFFDFYRSLQALAEGLPAETTTYVGAPDGEFFRYFGLGAGAPAPTKGGQ